VSCDRTENKYSMKHYYEYNLALGLEVALQWLECRLY